MDSIRDYAKSVGFEVVGKLTRKVQKVKKWDWAKGEEVTKSVIYWEDEAGNTYDTGCIATKIVIRLKKELEGGA